MGVATVPVIGRLVSLVTKVTTSNWLEHQSVTLKGVSKINGSSVYMVVEYGDYGVRLRDYTDAESRKESLSFFSIPSSTLSSDALINFLHRWSSRPYHAVSCNCQDFVKELFGIF